jgi:PKD repeat protein
VLDYNGILRKFNTNTGAMLWERNLRKLSYQGYPLKGARIGYEGKNYVVWFGPSDWIEGIIGIVKHIEDDSLIGTMIYGPPWASGAVGGTTIKGLSSAYLLSYTFYSQSSGTRSSSADGYLTIHKIERDTIRLFKERIYCGWYSFEFLFNPVSNKLVFKGINTSEQTIPYIGYTVYDSTYYFTIYDLAKDAAIGFLKHIPPGGVKYVNLLSLSNDGNLFWAKYKDRLFIIGINENIKVNEIKYDEEIPQALLSEKRDLLLFPKGNSIRLLNSRLLEPMDTISIGIEKEILGLKFSPGEDTLYFYNNNEIYRFKPDLTLTPLRAFFQTNVTEAVVGDTIRFYDGSSGYPESYHWDFGDGTTSDEKNPTHVYSNEGYFKPKLTITRGQEISQYEITLTISPALKADFQFVKDESVCPAVVKFENTSIGKIDSLRWDFGDGYSNTYSSEQEFIHYYGVNGTYPITLQIYGMKNSSKVVKKININVPVTQFQYGDFRYEINLDSQDGVVFYGFELPYKKILAKKSNSLMLLDSTGRIIGEKQGTAGVLAKNPYNNALYLINGKELKEIDRNGNMLRTFKDPDDVIITGIDFNGPRVYLTSGSIWNEKSAIVHYKCYFTELGDSISSYFKIIDRKLVDTGTFTFPNVPIRDWGYWDMLCIEAKATKNKSGNVKYFIAVEAHSIAEISTQAYSLFIPAGTIKFIKVNDDKINADYGVDFELSWYTSNAGPYRGLEYSWNRYQQNAIFLNDSVVVFSALNLKGLKDSLLPYLTIDSKLKNNRRYLNILNFNTKQMVTVPLNNSIIRTIQKLNGTSFAVALDGPNGLSSVIFNQKGEIINMVSHPCRYGKFEHVSITPDKQLLYSGGRYTNQEKIFPYFLKTNLPFIENLLSTPVSGVEVNSDNLPDFEYPYMVAYPNPTDGQFTLLLNANKGKKAKIELFDALGSPIKTLFVGEVTTTRLEFDISDVSSGVYFLKISQDEAVKILKIIRINN